LVEFDADFEVKEKILSGLYRTAPAENPARAALDALPVEVARGLFDKPLISAAVLVPIVMHADELTILLTRRTDHLRDHPGQIGFPGGRVEPGDEGPMQTALREAEEEIGLAPVQVQIAGYLETHAVVTGFAVTPVVGFIPPATDRTLDEFEVAEAFEVPLGFFLDETNLVRSVRRYRGVEVPLFEYQYGDRRIWGATAAMLQGFVKIINKNK
jgi:8-oxo-dGTP pyrophosphatase MutT (NUDIX family)